MMRKVLFSLATAAAALAVASPSSAQWGAPPPPAPYGYGYGYGQPQGYGYGYGQPQGYGYGYGHGQTHAAAMKARIDGLQRLINRLDRRDAIRDREANRLRQASRNIEQRLYRSTWNGLSPWEASDLQRRIGRLEQRIHYVLNDGHRWGRQDRRWNDFWSDRDWDGRNDRWEDDRGTRRDRR